ncbi:MAG: phospho-sugar mutase [Anaerofustis sp.]
MRDYQQVYRQWLESDYFDSATKNELKNISDPKEIEDRFYRDLEFGTGGLRGVIGAGTNRMNIYTVRRSTFGLANYLRQILPQKQLSAVISYDSRNYSREFAENAASVLCSCDIKTYLFDVLSPTPELSFAVRELSCDAGIMITASHNPKEYNGYKVYDHYGCQINPETANRVIEEIEKIKHYESIPYISLAVAQDKKLLLHAGEAIHLRFREEVLKQSLISDNAIKEKLSVLYTPLHGTGNIPVRTVLKEDGFRNVTVLAEQEQPDGNFSTVKSPNPEDGQALSMGIQKAKEIDADLVLGTDPDCDRVGIAVKTAGDYQLMTGNQVGVLLTDFILKRRSALQTLPNNGVVIKTIVTSEMSAPICKQYGVAMRDTLTGFKFIGELMTQFEQEQSYQFVFGYEESYGYLAGMHARDKDAVVASMLICEMVAHYKSQQKTLIDVLNELYLTYGYYIDHNDSFVFKGIQGQQFIADIMSDFRSCASDIFSENFEKKDYLEGIDEFPKTDVIKYFFHDGSWLAVRPSGTEPKIKFYYSLRGKNRQEAENRLAEKRNAVKKIVSRYE